MPTYQVSKSTLGSFNQGNISRFGETAGSQCACNALYSLFWSRTRSVQTWECSDLDMILVEGDRLYKSLNTNLHLNVDELPRTIQYNGIVCDITMLNLEDCFATLAPNYPLLQIPYSNTVPDSESLALMFIAGFTIAIMRLQNNTFFVFDSHSRDERGLSVPGGKSCVLEFHNIYELEKYIQVAYFEFQSVESIYFQIQFIEIANIPHELTGFLTREYQNFVASENYDQSDQIQKRQSNMKNREHAKNYYNQNKEKIKEKMKARYQKNKEKIKEKRKAQYESNKEKSKTQYENNRKKYKARYV